MNNDDKLLIQEWRDYADELKGTDDLAYLMLQNAANIVDYMRLDIEQKDEALGSALAVMNPASGFMKSLKGKSAKYVESVRDQIRAARDQRTRHYD